MVTPVSMEKLSLGDAGSPYCTSWAMLNTQVSQESNTLDYYDFHNNDYLTYFDPSLHYLDHETSVLPFPKLTCSQSTPTRPSSAMSCQSDVSEQDSERSSRFLGEIEKAREQLLHFRNEMDGLAKQMDGIELDLRDSKNRVLEIEQDLTNTQEVNVNLHVILERAVTKQKETDVTATRTMRHIHADLASVVHQTNQLQGRLATIATYQKEHQGNATNVVERMREYAEMLEQAQGTIKKLHIPRRRSGMSKDTFLSHPSSLDSTSIDSIDVDSTDIDSLDSLHSRRLSESSDGDSSHSPESDLMGKEHPVSPQTADLYRHRIIHKRTSLPGGSLVAPPLQPRILPASVPKPTNFIARPLPQQGLKLLFNSSQGGLGGLGQFK
ncbi:hypothetical protein BDF14DRAFT_1878816 [Spinellus fusiger]|nr:hypothetical protein BDF14DRAFT_1878816 [Spinellus fusiger]